MLDFSQMLFRLLLAFGLGALIGLERELAGKVAGVRTSMMVAGGAAMFSIIGLSLPYIVATSPEYVDEIISQNTGFLNAIANIVVGIGFLGAGIIIKTEEHVHGLTTAAVIWATAAVGILAGIGLTEFAMTSSVLMTVILFVLRKLHIAERIQGHRKHLEM